MSSPWSSNGDLFFSVACELGRRSTKLSQKRSQTSPFSLPRHQRLEPKQASGSPKTETSCRRKTYARSELQHTL